QLQALPRRLRREIQRQGRVFPFWVAPVVAPGGGGGGGGPTSRGGGVVAGGGPAAGPNPPPRGGPAARGGGGATQPPSGEYADADPCQQPQLVWGHRAAGDFHADHDCRTGEYHYAGERGPALPAVRREPHGGTDAAGHHGEWRGRWRRQRWRGGQFRWH